MKNPFNITKAVDYSDPEILEYWVDFDGGGFKEIFKPNSPMPMVLFGSKGSGKTHLMRYFSYQLQKIRWHSENITPITGISRDKYFGIFFRCSGLNSERFHGKGKSDEIWKTVFEYYMETWIGQLIIQTVIDFLEESEIIINENLICSQIIELFDVAPKINELKLSEIQRELGKIQKEMDFHINNWALSITTNIDFKILITAGKLIFGIPKIFSTIDIFKNVLFVYLIDEFENISEMQQKYFNTLYRERITPVSFKIGARLYGIKTYETYGGQEVNRKDSEYEEIVIDDFLRSNEVEYKKFIRAVCSKRLNEAGYRIQVHEIDKYFQSVDYKKIFERIRKKGDRLSKGHINKFIKNIDQLNSEQQNKIIENLKFNDDLLLERTNIFLFYREWKNRIGIDLVKVSSIIKEECAQYYITKKQDSQHGKVLDKFKYDIIDQLFRETSEKIPYAGFDYFIKMSSGNPRNLLTILKHAYKWASFNDNIRPFQDGKISIESQNKAVISTAEWFMEDNRIPGKEGSLTIRSFERISRLLQKLRFSDIPPECAISGFTCDINELSPEIHRIITRLEHWSYIIKSTRRDKNTIKNLASYKINSIIAPLWELSISKRGSFKLTQDELKKLILSNTDSDVDEFIKLRTLQYNSPFSNISQQLF